MLDGELATASNTMHFRRRSLRLRIALLPVLLCLLAGACGQKGDLYLPGKSGTQTLVPGSR